MTEYPDEDYVMMMIPHHESATEMANAVIKYGKGEQIKSIAENIKSDSQKEASELKGWLSAYK